MAETSAVHPTAKIGSIFYYMSSSIATQCASKSLLTVEQFHFPVAVTFMQMLFTSPTCYLVARPELQMRYAMAVAPLAAVNAINVVTGLMGTGGLNVPMFIVLRRFTMAFTLMLESAVYGVKHDWQVLASVGVMIFGAVLAAVTDLSFNIYGYAAVLCNDVFTALYLVMLKHMPISKELNTTSLLFYNSALSLAPLLVLSVALGDWHEMPSFPLLTDRGLQITLLATVALGLTINHSTYLCTQLNEPLTTSVAGSMKNVLMTIIGTVAFGDFKMHPWNSVGIVISMLGAIYYAHHAAYKKSTKPALSPPYNRDDAPDDSPSKAALIAADGKSGTELHVRVLDSQHPASNSQ